MEYYIPDYDIPVLERRASDGDLDAADRLARFYDSEIASMTARRDRIRALLASDEMIERRDRRDRARARLASEDEQHF